MQQSFDFCIQCVADIPGYYRFRGRSQQSSAARLAGLVGLDGGNAADGVLDRAVPCAAAEITLQDPRQVLAIFVVEGRCGHDHAGRTKTSLEARRLHECLLHRMQLPIPGESLDGGYLALPGAKGRDKAAMNRHAVDPYGARSAIARIATFFDAEPSELAQEGAQTLPRPRLVREGFAVDPIAHAVAWVASSRRISSAK